MAEETKVEATTEQESPTVEETQVDGEPIEAQSKVESADDKEKNWRALREENERLKRELEGVKPTKTEEVVEDVSPLNSVRQSPAVSFYLSPEVQNQLQFEEFKAEQAFPELESDPLLADAIQGKYRRALDEYVTQLANGVTPKFVPSVYRIAKEVDSKWKSKFGSVQKQAEEEGAKKAKQSVKEKEATVEAEGRSDRGRQAQEASDLSTLRRKTQEGNMDALAARLSKIK